MDARHLDRRRFIARTAAGVTTLLLGACDKLSESTWFPRILDSAEAVTKRVQRAITGSQALAREFSEADLSPEFKSNGTQDPDDATYQKLAKNGFKDWRPEVAGLVGRPAPLSPAGLRTLPSRMQITRHDCVEGWSRLGKWKSARPSALVDRVAVRPHARYAVFF